MTRVHILLFAFILSLSACRCNRDRDLRHDASVRVWKLDDIAGLHPYNHLGADVSEIQSNIFQPMLNFDFETLELIPILAIARPVIETDLDTSAGEVKMRLTFEIRPEAKWDNGQSITGKDV